MGRYSATFQPNWPSVADIARTEAFLCLDRLGKSAVDGTTPGRSKPARDLIKAARRAVTNGLSVEEFSVDLDRFYGNDEVEKLKPEVLACLAQYHRKRQDLMPRMSRRYGGYLE